MPKRLIKEEFIKKAKKVHGDTYDYSLIEYKNNQIRIDIICRKHGVFKQAPCKHLQGRICPYCSGGKIHKSEFIKKSNDIHNNKYDYSFVEFSSVKEFVKIICPIHGDFLQMVDAHMNSNGCPSCGSEKVSRLKYKNTTFFLEKSKEVHGDKYDYSKSIYIDSKTPIKIICKKHGEFCQISGNHFSGKGCPACRESKGENKIRKYLDRKKITFISQKKFTNCKNIKHLPFDFYLPEQNLCIEFNGLQHYKPIKYWGGEESLKKRKKNDKIKFDFCRKNNINFIIIKYNQNIEKALKKIL